MTVTPHFDIPFRLTGGPSQRIAYRDMILNDQPEAYWRLEASNASLDETGRHPLTFSGTTNPVPGLIRDGGQARDFTPGGTATAAALSPRQQPNGWSLEGWAWLTQAIPDYSMMIVCQSTTNYISLAPWGAVASMYGANGQIAASIAPAPVLNSLYHVVGTWDMETLTVYYNGQSNSVAAPSSYIDVGTQIIIGDYGGGTYHNKGYMDELAIYKYALTPAQVQRHYVAGKNGLLVAGAATNEQDSFEEITDCVEAILRTPLGFRSDVLSFGFPELELTTQPILNAAIVELVSDQEPRAQVVMTEKPDAFDPLIDRITATVSG